MALLSCGALTLPSRLTMTRSKTFRTSLKRIGVFGSGYRLQGYDCGIVYIIGKANPIDYLSRCSIQELRSMLDVHNTEESMVQRLRLGEGKSINEDIQKKLDEVFSMGNRRFQVSKTNVKQILYILSILLRQFFQLVQKILLEPEIKREIREGYITDTR